MINGTVKRLPGPGATNRAYLGTLEPRRAPVESDPFLGRCSSPTGGLAGAWNPPIPRRSGHLPRGLLILPCRISHFIRYDGRMAPPFAHAASRVGLANKVGRELGGPWDHSSSQRREQTARRRAPSGQGPSRLLMTVRPVAGGDDLGRASHTSTFYLFDLQLRACWVGGPVDSVKRTSPGLFFCFFLLLQILDRQSRNKMLNGCPKPHPACRARPNSIKTRCRCRTRLRVKKKKTRERVSRHVGARTAALEIRGD